MVESEEKGLHSIFITSTVVLIVAFMLLFMIVLTPSLSPVASIGDWDGDGHVNGSDEFPRDASEWTDSDSDGVGNNADAFPYDKNETADSDGDGVGDVADFMDSGNGCVRISLASFTFIGDEDYYRWRYYPFPWFRISVDLDGDGTYDAVHESPVFNGSLPLTDFYSLTVDVRDDAATFKFTIFAYDVWEVSNNLVTEYEIMDYSPVEGAQSTEHTVGLPYDGQWSASGEGDTYTPDCELAYAVETVTYD